MNDAVLKHTVLKDTAVKRCRAQRPKRLRASATSAGATGVTGATGLAGAGVEAQTTRTIGTSSAIPKPAVQVKAFNASSFSDAVTLAIRQHPFAVLIYLSAACFRKIQQ